MGQWTNGYNYYIGGYPNHRLDAGIVFRIRHYCDIRKVANRFLSAKFHEIWTQHVDRCCDESFWNRMLKIFRKQSFFQKRKKIENFSTSCATSGRHNSEMIIDRRTFITK